MRHINNQGFTLIELILVVGIVTLLAASSGTFYARFIRSNNHELTLDKILGSIRKAQANSIHGKHDASWGICMQDTTLRMYLGSCASPTISEDFEIPSATSISGLTDTTFSKRRGEPSSPRSITVDSGITSSTITLNAAGGIDVTN
jgi:prepilin-type N-terminal cleavage/methylation domain-containing protein